MKLISAILASIALALVALACVRLTTLYAAAAATRASGEANCTALLIAAWMLMGTSFVYLTLHNEIPTAASLAALVLHPASGAAALSVVQLVSRTPNHQWMIAVPLLGASALAAYVVYSVSGKLQSAWSPRIATAVTAAVVTVASMVPWPLALSR